MSIMQKIGFDNKVEAADEGLYHRDMAKAHKDLIDHHKKKAIKATNPRVTKWHTSRVIHHTVQYDKHLGMATN